MITEFSRPVTIGGLVPALPSSILEPLWVQVAARSPTSSTIPVIARCQQHKIRNVRDKLPQRLGGPVEHRMRTAYHAASALDAKAQLAALARELDKAHPGAAPACVRAWPTR
jgi:hypothetical protein